MKTHLLSHFPTHTSKQVPNPDTTPMTVNKNSVIAACGFNSTLHMVKKQWCHMNIWLQVHIPKQYVNKPLSLSLMQVTYVFKRASVRLFRFSSKCWIFLPAEYILSWNYNIPMSQNNINTNLHIYSQWHRFNYTASSKRACCCLTESIFYLPSFS